MKHFFWGGNILPYRRDSDCSIIKKKKLPCRRALSLLYVFSYLHFGRHDATKVGGVLLIIFCVLFNNVFAQSAGERAAVKAPEISKVYRPYLKGKVVSLDTAISLNATVKIEGTDILTYTDHEGNFNFRGVYVESGLLRVGHRMMDKPIYVAFDTINRGPFTVYLQNSTGNAKQDKKISALDTTQQIEEVSVVETGYFRVPEERATGSFVHIDNKLLSRSVGSNILERLNGVTRGLIFNQRIMGATTFAGQPSMSIRGISTLHANKEPLIILDNFPFEGDINAINPEDIESVTVLQDAAASSIWGARAGNGVIVLTSKKGRFEQPLKVSVRSDVSVSEKPNLYYNPTIPMDEFIEIERFLYGNGAWNGAINQVYPYITPTIEALLAHKNGHIDEAEMERRIAQLKTQDVRRDLTKYVFRPVQLYKGAANFRGGAKQHNYYFSAGYDKNLGNIYGYNDERITLQSRNSYRMLNNKLIFDTDLQFSSDKSRTGADAPYQVLYDRIADEHGNPLSIGGGRSSSGLRQSYIDTAGMGLLKDWNFYPLENIHQYNIAVTQTSYQVQPSVSYRPFDWLSVSANYRYSRSYSETQGLMDEDYFDMRDLYNRFTQIDYATGIATSSIPKGGRMNQTNSGMSTHYFRGSLNVDKTWSVVHQFHLVGGIEVNSRTTLYRSSPVMMGYQEATESYVPFDPTIRRRQYLTGNLSTMTNITPVNMTRRTTINRNRLFFANASYTYDKRYTATFSARKDEANIFGVDINKRGRPFWSAGLRWQLHEEDFYKVDWLSKLVLRATHGYTGNVSNGSAYITSRIEKDPYTRTGRIFQTITNPPNPQLSWENVRMNNLAIDFSVLNNRLSGSIEHYRKKAMDLLSSQPINPSSGVTKLSGNWSSLKGWGWDVNLNSRNILTKDFSWQSDLILSYTNERVTDYKLKPSSDLNYLTSNLGAYPIEGRPLYGIYSFASAGLDVNGQPQGYLDGVLSQDYTNIYNNTRLGDYVYHGRANPNLFGSIRNTFQYKALELSFNVSAQFGYHIRRTGLNYGTLYSVTSYYSLPFQYDYLNRWRQAGDELRTHVPAAAYPVINNRETFYNMTEHLVERGDHIRLRDIRLAYTLKLPQIGLHSVQVYGYANNLGVLWAANKLGFDPDAVYSNRMVYPAVRTYSFGVNVNF
ncbi:SusC/RagA family TonB-linked outer membrane protein [Sphingobacterium faecale]|uniref:SusC/RagA family TonB-linked outer membrane protein n=1 Tax=Sphingobacterium faecale TaxID=2803775 RepID=A0ABS1R987_9SPHI|nr:SusC/RagA family TonB-linked outer membrane protein [Sphingobacterium faecale]MBL1410381.1 SusC/RagA family TonB-linked outer membrane protein [Sphingobacterium faecale]